MAHATRDKEKLLTPVRRIRGQVEAVERVLAEEHECADVLPLVAARRRALNGLMAELIEGHIRSHVLSSNGRFSSGNRATLAVNPVGPRASHAAHNWHTGALRTGV